MKNIKNKIKIIQKSLYLLYWLCDNQRSEIRKN